LTFNTANDLSPILKNEITEKMEELEVLLYNYLLVSRVKGGTKGHKVGSKWNNIKSSKEFIINYA
jgi:hypothetical protein